MEKEQAERVPKDTGAHDDKRDLELMEIEIYRQHWRSLNAALAEIKELRGADAPDIDPVEFVKHEVNALKNQFTELKNLIAELKTQSQTQTQSQQAQQRFQPVPSVLPYFSTPNYAPMIQLPQ